MDSQKKFITKAGLQQLENYKYNSYGLTWVDSKMNIIWELMASLFSKSMAPNLITFIGFNFMILSYVVMLFYDCTFKKNIPNYCFFLAALFVFIYMNLDAIDGKQARNIKMTSPLGQLFDHGCDSFSLTFFALAVCQATKLQPTQVFLVFVSCQMAFFTSNWTEYHTGMLRTKIGQIGVTQVQFFCIFIHILTGIYGQQMWQIKVGDIVPDSIQLTHLGLYWIWMIKIKTVIVYGYTIAVCLSLLYVYFSTILLQRKKLRVAAQFLPLYILIAMEFIWFNYLPIYERYGGIILLNFGLLMSLMVCKMIVCSVTKMRFQYFHKQSIIFIVTTAFMMLIESQAQKKGRFTQKQAQKYIICVFWICFIVNLVSILRFLVRVITQLSDYLGIYCFSVQKRARKNQIKLSTQ